MSEERRDEGVRYLQEVEQYQNANPEADVVREKYDEEVATEFTTPMTLSRGYETDEGTEKESAGRLLGYSALALSILSLFILPVLMGAAGIVLGFVARRRGSGMLGAWAIGIGAVSVVVGLFVLPFF